MWRRTGRLRTAEKFFSRLASFSRLILFDKRGTGLSDRSSQLFTLEQRMDDVRAVMDAVGSEAGGALRDFRGRTDVDPFCFDLPRAGPPPSSCSAPTAKRAWAKDYPFGWKDEEWAMFFANVEGHWGTPRGHRSQRLGTECCTRRSRLPKGRSVHAGSGKPGSCQSRDADES